MYFKQTQQKFSQPIHYPSSTTLWDGLKAKYILLLLESAEEYCFKWSGREDLNLRPPAPKARGQHINPYFDYTYDDARCVLYH